MNGLSTHENAVLTHGTSKEHPYGIKVTPVFCLAHSLRTESSTRRIPFPISKVHAPALNRGTQYNPTRSNVVSY
jgi:hypothetical protein